MEELKHVIALLLEDAKRLQQILQNLNLHISNANHAIEGMKKLADEKAKSLQKQIDAATAVTDELQYIQKAADNVAQRLEKLTEQASAPNIEAVSAAICVRA